MPRPDPVDQVEEWSRLVAGGDVVEFGFDRRRTLVLVGIAVAFLAGAVILIVDGDRLGWPTLALSALGLVAVLRRGFGPSVVVDDRSIRYQRWRIDVPWGELDGATLFRSRGIEIVRLLVGPDHLAAHLADRHPVMRVLLRLDRVFRDGVNLPTPLDVDGETLVAWLSGEASSRRGEGGGEA